MLKIKTWRDPYDEGFSTTRRKEVELKEGLTILVGCNGIGKTTFLRNVEEQCKNEDIPVLFYSDMTDGRYHAMDNAMENGNIGLFSTLSYSSEGENIKMNFGTAITKVRKFLSTGFYDTMGNRFFQSLDKDEKKIMDKRRVLLFDSIDSGLSIDSITEVRNIFDLIQKDSKTVGVETYILVTANEYEMARKAPCLNASEGTYTEFSDYESYRTFIIRNRKTKEGRYKKKGVKNHE